METGKIAKTSGLVTALAYEFLGTAVLTWAFNISVRDDMVRALAFMAMYLLAVNVSGGHFNPATSVAIYLAEKNDRAKNLKYLILAIAAQVCGAFFGILVSYLLIKDYVRGATGTPADYSQNSYTLYPIPGRGASQGLYYYKGVGDAEPSVYVFRVALQEIL